MNIRHMLVRMLDRRVLVVVRVRLAAIPREIVHMPVMLVVPMRMRVPLRLVDVSMHMML